MSAHKPHSKPCNPMALLWHKPIKQVDFSENIPQKAPKEPRKKLLRKPPKLPGKEPPKLPPPTLDHLKKAVVFEEEALREIEAVLITEQEKARTPAPCLRFGPENLPIALYPANRIGRLTPPGTGSRIMPPQVAFGDGICIISINDCMMSLKHATIFSKDGNWFIKDLKSHMGTFVNNKRIGHRSPTKLERGDQVSFGRISFEFDDGSVPIEPANAAILMGNPGIPPLPGVMNDLSALESALSMRKNFNNRISVLSGPSCTLRAFSGCLQRIASSLSEDSLFVFYFSGHGSKSGLCLYDSELSPGLLFKALDGLRGQKLVLLDCCEAKPFTLHDDSDMLVITGESPEKLMYEGRVTCVWHHALLQKGSQGFLTRAFVKLLEECGSKINLKEAVHKLQDYPRLRKRGVELLVKGRTLHLRSALVRDKL